MQSYTQDTKIILAYLRTEAEKLNIISQEEDQDNIQNKINKILGSFSSIRFLYSDSYTADITDEIAIDKTQCLADMGVFILNEKSFSSKLKENLLLIYNVVGFLFDRSRNSYFINQDKLKTFADYLYQFEKTRNYESDQDHFNDSFNLYHVLDKVAHEVRKDEKYEDIEGTRQRIRKAYKTNRFLNEELKLNDFYFSEDEVGLDKYISTSDIIYEQIYLDNDKNIGGRVALADTNLEFEKLVSQNGKYRFRGPTLVNFVEIKDINALFFFAKEGKITIESIIFKS